MTNNKEFPIFSEWKKEIINNKDKRKWTEKELIDAYIAEKESFEEVKRNRPHGNIS